ncbi:MAG: SDR family NAD(P)-dependent oxidoreductase [Pseudomonadota bacterium]
MKTILILGATSAVAQAFARLKASEGDVNVVLAGRNREALERVAADLTARGAEAAEIVAGDIGASDAVPGLMEAASKPFGPPDEVLLAYGVLGDQTDQQADPVALAQLMEVNLVSAALWSELTLAAFEARGSGKLAILGSVAGDRGRQSNYLYGATKGALERVAEGMAHRAAAHKNITVTLVKPGFIDTPMTDHIEGKGGPLWATPEDVASITAKAMEKGRSRVYAPWFWRYILLIIRALPVPIMHRTKL